MPNIVMVRITFAQIFTLPARWASEVDDTRKRTATPDTTLKEMAPSWFNEKKKLVEKYWFVILRNLVSSARIVAEET